ncbi:MAG: DUF2785 domain-containing protein [Anaerolineales bacterium]|nr:MAG: DUF2785 domain-containing protein [Anaerolineales bacterium]
MDKKFWLGIRENQFAVPDGYSIEDLVDELLSLIASTDPELRDVIGYETYANWLEQEKIPAELMRICISRLTANFGHTLGERDTDTVFLRSFSVLLLAETVHHDNKVLVLKKEEIDDVLIKCLAYLKGERDPRGYVDGKGWAHALAHTADLLYTLASNRHTEPAQLEQILYAIAWKITESTDWAYRHGEDDRLMQAVAGAVKRNLLDESSYKEWLDSILMPTWKGSFTDETQNNAFFNTRNFLRSFYLFLLEAKEPAIRDFLFKETGSMLRRFKQF